MKPEDIVLPPAAPEALVRQSCEAIILAGRDGRIRLWNRGAQALFGFGETEALGASLDLIIPERFRRAHWHAYERTFAAGAVAHPGEVRLTRALHKDGRRLYVEMSFDLVHADDGTIIGAVAVARDGSERYALQQALRGPAEGQGQQPAGQGPGGAG